MKQFITIPEALQEIQKGRMLIVVDDPERENEGDLYIPTDHVTPEAITTMIRFAGGIVCTAITEAQAHRLSLPLMVPLQGNKEKTRVNFTVSVGARKSKGTGVSAFDRAHTIKILADQKSVKKDLVRPGHVFGLVARPGGVLERNGHTEAAVDFARLAGLNPAGVLCEVMGKNGKMAGRGEIMVLSKKLDIKVVLIRDLVRYLRKHPLPRLPEASKVILTATSRLSTKYDAFAVSVYESTADGREHVALVLGTPKEPVLTRIHSQCVTGDTFFSLQCDCGSQLEKSMEQIKKAGSGILLYLNQEGRDIGLTAKIRAYALQDRGLDTVEANHALGLSADARDYKIAADILKDIGIRGIHLLTNNPDKEKQLASCGIRIVKSIPLEPASNPLNKKYLRTKKNKMGHRLRKV